MSIFDILMDKYHPKIKERLEEFEISTDAYLLEWFITLFGRAFDIDIVSKIWDYLLLFGLEFVIFKMSLTLFSMMEKDLLNCKSDYLLDIIKQYTGLVEPNLLFRAFSKHKLQNEEFESILRENLDIYYLEEKRKGKA